MPTDPDIVTWWLRMALGDLLGARALLAAAEVPHREAAFLAHHAAEKALKAVLASSGREPPWTHDLLGLRSQTPQPVVTATSGLDLVALSAAGVAARYPDVDDPSYELDEVERLVAIAAEMLDIVRAHLEANGFDAAASIRPA